jgi:hypothetical protein
MAYIFLDESGNLGFDFKKKKTTKFFVITFLFIKNKKSIENIIKKVFRGLTKQELKHHPGVLHCYKEKPKTRLRLLNYLREKDISIISIYLNKQRVYTQLQEEKHILYNYVANILLDRVYTKNLIPTTETVHLIASRRETNKFLNQNFKDYLHRQVSSNHKINLQIDIKTPSEEKSLQIVDFICWSIFRKKEFEDESYYNLIKNKIVEESGLFL